MCKISVITPVYKVEKYLEKCIDSVLNQTFSDFELIIVDDGSPDRCGEIADTYEKIDERVHVIHKDNGGAPSARNEGIKVAKGEYLYFPDSDDWLEEDYLEKLYNVAVETNADLIISGFKMDYYDDENAVSYSVSKGNKVYDGKEKIRANIHKYFNNMMMAVPWNKLYNRKYIIDNDIFFPDMKWDDLHFNMEVIKHISKIAFTDTDGYHFLRLRPGSETTKIFDEMLYLKRREQFFHIVQVYKSWGIDDKKIINSLYGYYAARLIQCIEEISSSDKPRFIKKKLIKKIIFEKNNQRAFKYAKVDSILVQTLIIPAKIKSVTLCYWMGHFLGFVKKNMSGLFYKIKSECVNKARVAKSR